jgi:creatine kinase
MGNCTTANLKMGFGNENNADNESKWNSILDLIDSVRAKNPDNRMAKHFERAYFQGLSAEDKETLYRCCKTGIDNPTSSLGCYAMTPADYDKFNTFFDKVIRDYHKADVNAVHVTDWSLEGVEGLPADGKLDVTKLGLEELSMRVRVGRNLTDFPLPGAMTKRDRVNFEKRMLKAFDVLIKNKDYGGRVYSLTPNEGFSEGEEKKEDNPNLISNDEYKKLVADHIMFKDMAADPFLASAGIASDWPYGRGCYVSEDKQCIIWFGEEDQLRIMCMKKGTVLNEVFDRLRGMLDLVESIDGIKFAHSKKYGYVTSCPTNLGTGMRASVHIKIPNLTADGTDKKAKAVCKPLGLSVRGTGGEHTPIGADGTVDISPSARLFIKEAEIITALYQGIELLMEQENKGK